MCTGVGCTLIGSGGACGPSSGVAGRWWASWGATTRTTLACSTVVRPGDELVTHCVFDSSQRDVPTLGGHGSDDEMSLNHLFHWPAVPFPLHCNE